MKSFKTVFAILVSLGIHTAMSAGTNGKHQGNKSVNTDSRELKKFDGTENSFEIFGIKSVDYSDHVRKMVHGNQITAFDSAENAYRPLEIADRISAIEKDRSITEYEEPQIANLRISELRLTETRLSKPAKL